MNKLLVNTGLVVESVTDVVEVVVIISVDVIVVSKKCIFIFKRLIKYLNKPDVASVAIKKKKRIVC